jgi:hypothetical protein
MSSKRFLLQLAAILVFLSAAWSKDTGSATLTGHIQFNQSTVGLVARLYSPKSSITTQQAQSDARRVRVAFIGADGQFQFSGLQSSSYLLEIYAGQQLLYQKVVSTQDPQPLEIELGAPIFKKKNWRPSDMTADPTAGVFVLDHEGGISRLTANPQAAKIDLLFRLKPTYRGNALAATSDSIYVVAQSDLGCSLIRFSLSNRKTNERLLGPKLTCTGIAANGTTLYVTTPESNEICVLASWDKSSCRGWTVGNTQTQGPMTFDRIGNRLLLGDQSGNLYAVSVADGSNQLLTSGLGWIASIAASQAHILIGSGSTVFSFSRADNQRETPPSSLQSLTGGHIVGLAVDGSGSAWFADWDKELVEGPLPLN